ncbi:arylsulfatase [Gilvimarinus sp. SDUM040013]|uniref:Arylsulfatase n=1 Tax=Gilvimarinus gilvus TaxID=3058038 RepID=A0ABU4S648_9GAMM|nr:arylsulfatase [Gilvimarinus sp. SDUM040013]MDO3384701.1 arylsulfatase [Gilvimarinus sp. SDUM040013]MDX6850824.1 arylsulfatase [Gilvimarinus sp. SDUM040013]
MRLPLLSGLVTLIVLCGCQTQPDIDAISRPNVLLVLTDDMGWGDVAANGNPNIQTPTIDHLMNNGVTFDRFYVSPVCSPTRASLLTGRHSLATGVYSVTRGGEKMFPSEVTIAEIFKGAGYRTGLFGKWHNGLQYPYDPNGQGFEEFYGFADGHITDYFDGEVQHNQSTENFTGYLPDRLTDKTLEFIQESDSPFFAMLSFNTPHSPFELPQALFDQYKLIGLDNVDASVFGMVENIDTNLQRLLNQLDRRGALDNTLVVFLSDNGPAFPGGNSRYNGDMKGSKGKVDEGGVRVPFAIYWQGHLRSGYRVTTPGQHIDLLPTLLTLTGLKSTQPNNIHGVDLSPAIKGENVAALNKRPLFTHHFRNTRRPEQQAVQASPGAIRQEGWLATTDHQQRWQLYNLATDPQQKVNLAEKNPEKLNDLKNQYLQWYQDTRLNEYRALPIPVGHAGIPYTMFPAHEAEITREGVEYHFQDGWAHDWVESVSQQPGQIRWPLEVVKAGRYTLTLGYDTPQKKYSGEVTLSIGKQKIVLRDFAPFKSKERMGKRLAHTSEAPTKSWGKHAKTLHLAKGRYDLTLDFASDPQNRSLAIKYIEIGTQQ